MSLTSDRVPGSQYASYRIVEVRQNLRSNSLLILLYYTVRKQKTADGATRGEDGLLPCLPVKRATHSCGRKHDERSPNPVRGGG